MNIKHEDVTYNDCKLDVLYVYLHWRIYVYQMIISGKSCQQ